MQEVNLIPSHSTHVSHVRGRNEEPQLRDQAGISCHQPLHMAPSCYWASSEQAQSWQYCPYKKECYADCVLCDTRVKGVMGVAQAP